MFKRRSYFLWYSFIFGVFFCHKNVWPIQIYNKSLKWWQLLKKDFKPNQHLNYSQISLSKNNTSLTVTFVDEITPVMTNVQPKSTLYMNQKSVFTINQTIVFLWNIKEALLFIYPLKSPYFSLDIESVIYTSKIFLQFFLFQKLNLRKGWQYVILLVHRQYIFSLILTVQILADDSFDKKLKSAICWFKIKLFAQVLHSNILNDPSEIIHSIGNQLRGARGVAVQS